ARGRCAPSRETVGAGRRTLDQLPIRLLDQAVVGRAREGVGLVVEVEPDVSVELQVPADELQGNVDAAPARATRVAAHLDDRGRRIERPGDVDVPTAGQAD